MFFPLFGMVFTLVLSIGLRAGPGRAVAAGWVPAAFLLPVWMIAGIGSANLDLRTAAALGVLAAFVVAPPASQLRFTPPDALILMLLLVVAISQNAAGSLRPLTMPEIARKWLLPYLMGRLLLDSTSDIPAMLSGIARAIVGLTGYAMVECFTKINFINVALGKSYDLLEQGEGYRWGLKRAHVMFDHPIFFGMGLVLLLPWALEASRLAKLGKGPKWWRRLPLMMTAALFATVSRGPQIAAMATAGIYYFFRIPKLRAPLLIVAIGGGVGAVVFQEQIIDLLAVIAGEKGGDEEPIIIKIEGEEVEYTGTNHRVLLFRVYDEPIKRVGWFGYGTELAGVELEESIAQRFGSIDCHYLLFLLQHGYLGIGSFIILTLVILLDLGRIAIRHTLPEAGLAAGLFGALLAVAVLLMSVWFSPDFAGIWLFSAGLAGRLPYLASSPQSVLQPASPSVAAPAAAADTVPQLPPAHAPLRPLNPVIDYASPAIRPIARH